MIAIVDYGMANLRSVEKALIRVGGDPQITGDPDVIAKADKVVLPGVGAFCAAMTNLECRGLRQAVQESIQSGKPFLGICLGLQMLFDSSTEMGATAGLGILPGKVVAFFANSDSNSATNAIPDPAAIRHPLCFSPTSRQPPAAGHSAFPQPAVDLKVPHIGWNGLHLHGKSRLLAGLEDGVRVYFVHSYFPQPADASIITATCDYGGEFCCAIEKDNVAAVQFHPEKSGDVGLRILRNFVAWD